MVARYVFWDGNVWREVVMAPGMTYQKPEQAIELEAGDTFCAHLSHPGSTQNLPDGLRFGKWLEEKNCLREITE